VRNTRHRRHNAPSKHRPPRRLAALRSSTAQLQHPRRCPGLSTGPSPTSARLLGLTHTDTPPQFEVIFSDSPIPESEALSLVDSANPTYSSDLSSETDLTSHVHSSPATPNSLDDSDTILSQTYTLLTLPPATYLCSIPLLAPPPPPNQTFTALLRAEEARERDRASASGWSIINASLDGHCLYYMSGWWSYSFCYNRDIVQFHALPNGLKTAGAPPVRDPQSAEYVLGRVHYDHHPHQPEGGGEEEREGTTGTKELSAPPPNSELAVKDNQRYLVQRLDGGTLCDLTGRERTIEVQYHCHPGIPGERIGWIKEVTTCTYLMVVQTPRLCQDVAFMPPKEGRAHPITCRLVGASDKDGHGRSWLGIKGKEAGEGLASAADKAAEVILSAATGAAKDKTSTGGGGGGGGGKPVPVTIGGVVVGGRKMLGTGADGTPAARLPPPRHLGGPKQGGGGGGAAGAVVEVLAKGTSKADGGKVEVLTREELESLDLSAEAIEELRKELQKLAGDNGWKLEVVEVPGEGAEIRGIVEGPDDDDDDEEEEEEEEGKGQGATERGGKRENDKVFRAEKSRKRKGEDRDRGGKDDKGDDGQDEGSEEVFYRDEL